MSYWIYPQGPGWPVTTGYPSVCPGCGRCNTCGKGGSPFYPMSPMWDSTYGMDNTTHQYPTQEPQQDQESPFQKYLRKSPLHKVTGAGTPIQEEALDSMHREWELGLDKDMD